MKEHQKTKAQLINELAELRQRLSELENTAISYAAHKGSLQKGELPPPQRLSNPLYALQKIINSTSAIIFSVDTHYHYTAFNQNHALTMENNYGAKIELGHSILDYISVIEDRNKAKHNFERALAGEQFSESATSSKRYYESMHTPIKDENGAIIGVVVFSNEVTAYKQVEEALKNSDKLFRTVFDLSTIGIALVGMDGRFQQVNPALCNMVGYTAEELCQKSFNDITHEADKKIGLDFIRDVLLGNVNNTRYDKRYIHKNGSSIWVYVSNDVVRNTAGQAEYFIAHIQNITESKHAQEELEKHQTSLEILIQQRTEELQASEMRYRSLFENMSSVILIIAPHTGAILDANSAACTFYGYPHASLIKMTILDITTATPEETLVELEQACAGKKTHFINLHHRLANEKFMM